MNLCDATRTEAKNEGFTIGKEEGIAIGEAQALIKTYRAIEMLKEGKSVDFIATEVSLKKSDVEYLKSVMIH